MANTMGAKEDLFNRDMEQSDIKDIMATSPSSGNSSDTLHDNESFGDERKLASVSLFSDSTLKFGDLSIYDDGDTKDSQEHANQFPDTFYRNMKNHHMPAATYEHQVPSFSRNSHHFNQSHAFERGSSIQRNARVWVSEESRAAQEFLTLRNSMRRRFKNADVAKWKVTDFIAHREAVLASKAQQFTQQSQTRESERDFHIPSIPPQKQDMMRRCGLSGNFDQIGNFSRALGEKTIWCEDWQNGKEEIAPWPCMAELKWEGDDRAKTGVGRYPPLPREQGPIGLPWNQLQAIEQYPLDQIARIPTMEDIYLPVDEIDDEVKSDLLNKDLEDAISAYLES